MYQIGNCRLLSQKISEPVKKEGDFVIIGKQSKLYTFTQEINKKNNSQGIFIHGGPGYPINNTIKAFEEIPCIKSLLYYHQRGCGKSCRPIDTFESNDFMLNAKVLVRHLGVRQHLLDIEKIRILTGQEKIILIGQSFGAFLASLYAAEFPEKVKALVLISPAAMLKMPNKSNNLFKLIEDKLCQTSRNQYKAFLKKYFNYNGIFRKAEKELAETGAQIEPFWEEAYSKCMPPNYYSDKLEDIGGWMPHAIYFSLGKQYNLMDSLNAIKAKTLIIHGENDLQSVSVAKVYLRSIPKSHLKIISQAGHFSYHENQPEFISNMIEFLSNVD